MDKNAAKLYDAAIKSHEILFSVDTVFPFILFPDTLTIDREKLTIVHRAFFRIAKITTVQIRDILNAEADIGPFFGSIHVTSRYFVNNPQTVNFLWRKDAVKAHRLLQGYIIATQKEIDCNSIPKDELLILLQDLGKGATD